MNTGAICGYKYIDLPAVVDLEEDKEGDAHLSTIFLNFFLPRNLTKRDKGNLMVSWLVRSYGPEPNHGPDFQKS